MGIDWNGMEWNMVVVPMNETRPFNESSTLGNHPRYNEKTMFKSILQIPKNDMGGDVHFRQTSRF
jgi:hypothetical protein